MNEKKCSDDNNNVANGWLDESVSFEKCEQYAADNENSNLLSRDISDEKRIGRGWFCFEHDFICMDKSEEKSQTENRKLRMINPEWSVSRRRRH